MKQSTLKNYILTCILVLSGITWSSAQVYYHNMEGATDGDNTYNVAPTTSDPSVTNSVWTSNGNNWGQSGGASGVAITTSGFPANGSPESYTLTFDVASGCALNISEISFWQDASGSGPSNWELLVNGVSVGSGGTTGGSVVGTGTISVSGLSGNITIEIVLTGATSGGGTFRIDDFTILGNLNCSNNDISVDAVSAVPFDVSCTLGDNGTVNFSSVGNFNPGNTFTVQLSDASGSFSAPTNIGSTSMSGTDPAGSINFTIPPGTSTGSGYLIRIISNDPAVVSSSSSSFQVNLTGICATPHITSLIFDGCNDVCNATEGTTEIIFANTGNYSLQVTSANIDLNYPSSPDYDVLGTLVDQPDSTTVMNNAAGCGALYLDAYNQVVPPNSVMIFVPSDMPTCAFDWSSLCGQGPVYVVYGLSGTGGDTWHTNGNFGNSSGMKDFELVITPTNGTTYSTTYEYDGSVGSGDGDYATYGSSPPGGMASTQGNFPDCSFDPVIALGVNLTQFEVYYQNNQVYLNWATNKERNNQHYDISRSQDGYEWIKIGSVAGSGSTTLPNSYYFIDKEPKYGVSYYKLESVDFDGKRHAKGIKALTIEQQELISYNQQTKSIELKEASSIQIYSLDGKLVSVSSNQKSIPFYQRGMYVIRFVETGKSQRIIIQ